MRRVLAGLVTIGMVVAGAYAARADAGGAVAPSRRDVGALIVLDLHGSYAEMGRQAVALLGAEARVAHEVYADRWRGLVRAQGLLGRLVDGVVFPVWTTFGGWREDSGFFAETGAIGRALAARRSDGVRLLYGGVFGGGSTVFAATGAATADRRALIGRNVDWSDDTGRRPPVVARYHPTNGDLAHLTVSWPLIVVPIVGVNAAGLAISINFFDADAMLGLGFPRILYRRVLQTARTVAEAIALLLDDEGNRGGAGILVLADAAGDLALVECTATACAVHRPPEGWLGQANHARTAVMHDHDEGRTADSARRRAAMEAAVRPHVGRLTPEIASEILRDRANSPYLNDATVANPRVLNAVVVDPAARTLWHSTAQQPVAPFGELVPFTVDGAPPAAASLPADPRLGGAAFRREVEVVAAMRQAARLFAAGRVGDAGALWDRLAVDAAGVLEPHRLAFARARARWSIGRLAAAEALLAEADRDGAPFEVRAYARVARGWVADRTGRRGAARAHYAAAAALLDAHPEWDAPFLVAPLRRWIADGLARPAAGAFPATPDLQCIPQ